LLLAGLTLCASWCRRTWKHGDAANKHRMGAVAAGLLAGSLHSLVDFVWYLPGYMIVTLVLAACACRCAQMTRPERPHAIPNRSARLLAWTLILAVIPVGRFCTDNLERSIAAARSWSAYRMQTVLTAKRTHYGSTKSLDTSLKELIANLEACVRCNPQDYRAASTLAALYLRRLEVSLQSAANRMTLRQVQDTVRNAEFASADQTRDWLFRAFGDAAADLYRAQGAARYGLQGQPLRGETYIVLAEVAFLDGHADEPRTALVEQAVKLRPHTPPVLYSAGALMADTGDWDTAFEYWRRAITYDVDGQPQLIRQLAPYYTATELIDRLRPAATGVWLLFQEYGELDQADDRLAAARYFQQNLKRFVSEAGCAEVTFWERGFQMLTATGQQTWARHCLQEAVRAAPEDRTLRRKLAAVLLQHQQFDEAIRELQWCQLRDPEDQEVAAALRNAQAQRSAPFAGSKIERAAF
jgi:tetratricopeptide (TPR) repeat protein